MHGRNLIAGLVLCAVAGTYAYLIGTIPDRSLPNTPGPTFMPWLIALAMGALSLALVVQGSMGLRSARGSDRSEAIEGLDGKTIALLGAMVAYVIAIPLVGFLIASMIFFAVAMVLFGARNPIVVACASIVVPIALQFLFRNAFSIILPAGLF